MKTLAILLILMLGVTAHAAEQPNIIVYMVDDLGWNHIGVEQVTMGDARPAVCDAPLGAAREGRIEFYACLCPAELRADSGGHANRTVPGADPQRCLRRGEP